MKNSWKKWLAASLTGSLCLLTACTNAPDNKEDPLAGHNINALLPFHTRVPDAVSTATPTPTPTSTSIVTLPQDWQSEYVPGVSLPTSTPTASPTVRPSYTFSRLEQGDSGEEVRRLQSRLIELGYLSGTADGNFGANTKLAVKRFQKALGLSQTGVATVSLQEKLFIGSAPVYIPNIPTATPTASIPESTVYEPLVRGDRGENVANLQRRLIELGYLSGTADGVFGANTENAVKVFQSQLGLSQTGVASASLQINLYSVNAPFAPVVTRVPTQAPTPTPTPTLNIYQALEPGDSGEAVVRMQNRLKELGYFTGSSTGNYYRETTAAVQLFQAELGLSQTGIASSSLLVKLYSSNAPYYSGQTEAPTPTPEGYITLKYGSRGTEVLNLQKRLIALGYMTTTADGEYGRNTENAVKLFQSTIGYTQNGVASVGLQNLLFSDNAPVYVPSNTIVPTQVPSNPANRYELLQPGDSGTAVKNLQQRLKELGFFSGQIKGNYLTKTTDSVRLFQAAIGYAQTGIATPELQEILYSDDAPDYNSVKSEYVLLEKLDSGIQVLYLQQRLKELGYLTGTADGDFGTQTENAVKAFQAEANLEVTGKATPATQEILFSAYAPYAPVATPIPTQVPTQVPTQRPTNTPAPTGYTTLRNGSTGSAVQELQRRLKELGYFEGNVVGNYLLKTETAVKLFQAAIGYNVDGVATSDLQTLLYSTSAPIYDGTSYIELEKGMTSPAVKNLQRQLIRLNYLSGSADGEFGSATEKAIKKFQNVLGWNEDGVASVDLQYVLFSTDEPYEPVVTNAPTSIPSVPTQKPTSIPTQAPSTTYRTIKNGNDGEDVKAIQIRLTELGYYNGLLKGNYLDITELAFMLFQAQHGYTPDGVATPAQQQLLFSSSARYYDASAYIDLEKGDEGIAVQTLQARLIELGYLSGSADGDYGDGTKKAVKKFQEQINYSSTNGEATAALQKKLFAADAPAYGTGSGNTGSGNQSSYRTIREGNSGEDVKAIQIRLNELGYYDGLYKGNYLEITELAFMLFQAQNGYTPDGVATPAQQEFLFSSAAPEYNGKSFIDLEKDDEGVAVKTLQARLIELGYLSGTADGEYGSGTQTAVKKFQQQINYSSTNGKATADLQKKLFASDAPAYGSGSGNNGGSGSSSSTGNLNDYRTIKDGNSGEDVKAIQRRLKELGYFHGNIGGNYLTQTQTAVKLFQTAIGYTADGVATPLLQVRLFSSNAPAYIEPASKPDQYDILARGDSGSGVKSLQKRLIQLGWMSGSADGDFGAGTEQALMNFQYRVGLNADGIAGIEVQDILYAPTAPQYVAYKHLEPGATGDAVFNMQLRLIELGYLSEKASNLDGIYGNGLKDALSKLQIASGVDARQADGIATVDLQTFLFSANADLYAR